MIHLVCPRCARRYPEEALRWVCECGSPLDLVAPFAFPKSSFSARAPNLWRYREALPLSPSSQPASLGETLTPLIQPDPAFPRLFLKLDFLFPTGSFKDRGSALLISKARELGVPFLIEDSSGNAGASIAAYCAAAGIACQIFVPASTAEAKLTQIRAYGAQLVQVEGSREETAKAAKEAAQRAYYASHSLNPYFLEGTKTFAFEVWEQLGGRAPDLLILPVGNGTLLLGAYLGFSQLKEAREITKLPRIIGVQSEHCPPLYMAYVEGREEVPPIRKTETIAEGISISQPVRGRQILRAVRSSGGFFLVVKDEEVVASLRQMARMGLYIEPTSATAIAAWQKIRGQEGMAEQTVLIPLTGSGLKASHAMAKLLGESQCPLPIRSKEKR
ncbi:MAG: threonine synthase [candidate division NC10 bacterium]|nr:threonine synthase [candidate division NC10 bacterium]